MDSGTFDVIFENEKACEVKIEEAGLKTQFSCFSPDVCGDVLRLAAVTQGRYEVIGVMMPAKAGGLELRKSFTRSELKSKALDTAEGYVLIRQGETYTSPEITENRGEEEPQPVSGEPENLPEEWRACRNPGELFSDIDVYKRQAPASRMAESTERGMASFRAQEKSTMRTESARVRFLVIRPVIMLPARV